MYVKAYVFNIHSCILVTVEVYIKTADCSHAIKGTWRAEKG